MPQESESPVPPTSANKPASDWIGATLALVGIGLSALYLANPTVGVFEFIPDNLPVVGNIDEATATALLIACLSRFGIHLTPNLSRKNSPKKID